MRTSRQSFVFDNMLDFAITIEARMKKKNQTVIMIPFTLVTRILLLLQMMALKMTLMKHGSAFITGNF